MKRLLLPLLCFVLVLTGCKPAETVDVGNVVQTAAAQTQAIDDAVATVVALTLTAKHPTPTVTLTSTPVTPTSTPVPPVTAITVGNANCRSGPAGNFDNVIAISPGAEVRVIGKTDQETLWWQIEFEDYQCWVTDAALSITGDAGNLPIVVSPPTPTPKKVPTWSGTWNFWIWGGFSGATEEVGSMVCSQTGVTVVCNFQAWDLSFVLNATSSADGMTLTGKLSRVKPSNTWDAYLVRDTSNPGLYRGRWWVPGNTTYDGAWCGTNNNSSKPPNCKP